MSEAATAVSTLLSYGQQQQQQQAQAPQPPPPGRPSYSLPSLAGMPLPVESPHSVSQFPRNPQDLSLRHPADSSDMATDDHQLTSGDQQYMEVNSSIHPDRTHICPNCSKGFKSKQQLAQHNLVHSGIRKHICSFCDKGFKQLCHLQQHLRIHTGEKPYRCCFDGCERAFAQMANLHHHMRNHEDHVKKAANKQYQCSVCSRAYTNESSLKNHTIKMHVNVRPLEGPYPLPYKPRKPRQSSANNSKTDPNKEKESSIPLSFISDPRTSNFSRFIDLHKDNLSRSLESNQHSPSMSTEQSSNISSTTLLSSPPHVQTPLMPPHSIPPLSLISSTMSPSLMSPSFMSQLQQTVQNSSGHLSHLLSSSSRPAPQEHHQSSPHQRHAPQEHHQSSPHQRHAPQEHHQSSPHQRHAPQEHHQRPAPHEHHQSSPHQPHTSSSSRVTPTSHQPHPSSSSARVTPTSQDQRSTPQQSPSSLANGESSLPRKEAAEPSSSHGLHYNLPLPHPLPIQQNSLLTLSSRLNMY